MSLLQAFLLIGLALVFIRQILFLYWSRSQCPVCKYSLQRIKPGPWDKRLGQVMFAPVNRYKCQHYRCSWTGLSVSAIDRIAESTNGKGKNGWVKESKTLAVEPSVKPTVTDPASVMTSDPPKRSELHILEKSLQQSLKKGEFTIQYQPKVNIETNDIIGMEALLRWNHPTNGSISPAKFIPLVEEYDLIVTIGEWMLNKVCLQVKHWQDRGLSPLTISVNLSAKEFYQASLVPMVEKALTETGLDPHCLELEVSESMVMQNVESAKQILTNLQALGVQVAIDDFGTGNSSLLELRQFALNTLKIDQSLIQKLKVGSKKDIGTIQSCLSLAKGLNCRVVAEGVETSEQLHLLRSLGCETAQGYLYDHPLSSEDAMDVLQANWLGRRSPQKQTGMA
ncbi:MAG: EAL domain-containing protein [Acaryochloridaceae cyanobacterium RU_4_10]|nr:EAL domain-containing protein [Acaryochloridaceae cyanobacterium RU_4_10]